MKTVLSKIVCLVFIFSCKSNDKSSNKLENNPYPSVVLQNDYLKVTVLLPDSVNGYYRSTRFDWSGIVAQVDYSGHTFFKEWNKTFNNQFLFNDSLNPDNATGTADEFRNPLGYEDAAIGGPFLKVGVGILKKSKNEDYHWSYPYEFLKRGEWEIECTKNKILFKQQVLTSFGYSYEYTKTVLLDSFQPEISILYTIKNTGIKNIKTNPYCHNFFNFNGRQINKEYKLSFPVPIKALSNFDTCFNIGHNFIQYESTDDDLPWSGGFIESEGIRCYTLTNSETKTSVEVISDTQYDPFYIGASRDVFCPEPMILLDINPGKSYSWSRIYKFRTKY